MNIQTLAYGATHFRKSLSLKKFERKGPGPNDVLIQVSHCGVCHSDVHQVNNDWKNTVWPCVPGHEAIGTVSEVGASVTRFKIGDTVAVGCMIDSCGECYSCKRGEEQYCEQGPGFLGTYNGPINPTGQNTYGGYSSHLVVKEHFVLAVPQGIPAEVAGPILCAGVTTYSPLKHWGIKSGMQVGVAGLGGLGHMAAQIAKAMGATVTVITTSEEKTEDAMRFGASKVVVSTKKEQMTEAAKSLDFILNTIPEKHDVEPYLDLLHRDGAMVIVGVLVPEPSWNPQKIIMHRRTLSGSLIGSIAETQEVLEFCAKHKTFPQVELIGVNKLDEAYKNIEDKIARYRYVLDLSSLQAVDLQTADEIDPVGHLLERQRSLLRPEPPVHAGLTRDNFSPKWESIAGA